MSASACGQRAANRGEIDPQTHPAILKSSPYEMKSHASTHDVAGVVQTFPKANDQLPVLRFKRRTRSCLIRSAHPQ